MKVLAFLGAVGLGLVLAGGLAGWASQSKAAPEEREAVATRGGEGEATPAAGRRQAGDSAQAASAQASMAFPTGDRATSTVLLTATNPGQVRVGQQYTYNLTVTNLTDAPLHNVAVRNLGSVRGADAPRGGDEATPAGAAIKTGRTGEAATDAETVRRTAGTERAAGTATNRQIEARRTEMTASETQPLWTVGTLGPRQSQTKQFTEVADEIGVINNCLSVDYSPTLCVAVQVVKPELSVTKTIPEAVLICDPIPVTYRVTNTGTGVAQGVRLEDTLPEGLQTADNRTAVAETVGDIAAGDTKEVVVRLKANRTGQFASRATARSTAVAAQSREVGTVVREPVLAIGVEGPEAAYLGQGINYRVTVRNAGDAPAANTVLRLVTNGGGQLEPRNLGTIEVGASRTVAVTTGPIRTGRDVTLTATAEATCARPVNDQATVAIRTVPALALECIDSVDPIGVNGNTVYTITVINQGTGPDSNIRLTATLPEEQQFVRAGGSTNITNQGRTLTFGPVATLEAGARVTWTVEVKAIRAGDVRFGLEMISDSMSQPAGETEPTKQIINAARDPVQGAEGDGTRAPRDR